MLYAVYFIAVIFHVVMGASADRLFTNFFDYTSMGFVLLPCVFILLCTKSFPPFGRAFLFAFGKKEYSLPQYKASDQSVKMVVRTAVLFGGLGFIIGMVNSLRCMDLSNMGVAIWVLADLAVAMLPLFYGLVVCMLLLPLSFMLKQHIIFLEAAASKRSLLSGEKSKKPGEGEGLDGQKS